ncbi:hypothetical protein [Halotia branconii]|uniref:Uncharacterized protein n=1 Tax=Halotia branconii CENA392 TaxID=1539056 RepID=A0AAJ6NQ14_9CYAN|nr:hypothetical protein [Halotia branconii]WGV24458.1 hypothetical protein QI031_22155 [Halotia branconii CENA392]
MTRRGREQVSQRGKAARSWGFPPKATAAPLVGHGEAVRPCGSQGTPLGGFPDL